MRDFGGDFGRIQYVYMHFLAPSTAPAIIDEPLIPERCIDFLPCNRNRSRDAVQPFLAPLHSRETQHLLRRPPRSGISHRASSPPTAILPPRQSLHDSIRSHRARAAVGWTEGGRTARYCGERTGRKVVLSFSGKDRVAAVK